MSDKVSGIALELFGVGVNIYFEKRDMWIGLFWDNDEQEDEFGNPVYVHFAYVCIVPMVPIRFMWVTK